jgi:PAS domain S-box-containing protein
MNASAAQKPDRPGHDTEVILWEADPTTFQFRYVSSSAERLFGFSLQRWLTQSNFWVDLLHPLDRARAVNECLQAVQAGEDHEMEYRVRIADGRVRWVHDLVRVISDERGVPTALHGAMVDVTDRRLLVDQVLHAQATEALGRLTNAIAPGRIGFVDVNAELRSMQGLLRQLVPSNVELEMTLGASRSLVVLGAGVLEQIVVNLVLNARDAMPAGGTLQIVTFDTPLIQRAGLPETPPQLVLEIEDTGSGIPPDVRPRLFEPYFTTKKGGARTGLGLSIVDRFVREAGGHIEWTTAVLHGTRFRIFLPLAME